MHQANKLKVKTKNKKLQSAFPGHEETFMKNIDYGKVLITQK